MKKGLAVFLLVFAAGPAFAEKVVFTRSCTVYASPDIESKRICRKPSGSRIVRMGRKKTEGFVKVDTGDCIGFVSNSCLATQRESTTNRVSSDMASSTPYSFRIGVGAEGGLLFGRVNTDDDGSNGLDLGGALHFTLPLSGSFALTLKASYQILSLTRTVDGSGVIVNPTPTEFTQKVAHAGVGLFGELLIRRGQGISGSGRDPNWWLLGGAEYLIPVSATQTDSIGGDVSFDTTDKPVLLVLGAGADFPLSPTFHLVGSIQAFYNLAARDSRLFGTRLSVAGAFIL